MTNLIKKNTNLLTVSIKEVEDKIVTLRGQDVIADADVAALYKVQTKEVNQVVRNNPDKFNAYGNNRIRKNSTSWDVWK